MQPKRTDRKREAVTPAVHAQVEADRWIADRWIGEDSAWLEAPDLVQRRPEARSEPDGVSVRLFRALLVCALLGGILWALTGYGIYRLVSG
jgi:hypothetical protein